MEEESLLSEIDQTSIWDETDIEFDIWGAELKLFHFFSPNPGPWAQCYKKIASDMWKLSWDFIFFKFATYLVDLFIYWISRDSFLTWNAGAIRLNISHMH